MLQNTGALPKTKENANSRLPTSDHSDFGNIISGDNVALELIIPYWPGRCQPSIGSRRQLRPRTVNAILGFCFSFACVEVITEPHIPTLVSGAFFKIPGEWRMARLSTPYPLKTLSFPRRVDMPAAAGWLAGIPTKLRCLPLSVIHITWFSHQASSRDNSTWPGIIAPLPHPEWGTSNHPSYCYCLGAERRCGTNFKALHGLKKPTWAEANIQGHPPPLNERPLPRSQGHHQSELLQMIGCNLEGAISKYPVPSPRLPHLTHSVKGIPLYSSV